MIVADFDIDRSVELDARHFSARKQPLNVDIVDLIARDGAERAAQAAHNTGLLAV